MAAAAADSAQPPPPQSHIVELQAHGVRVVVVGTAHVLKQSVNDVIAVIEREKPGLVCHSQEIPLAVRSGDRGQVEPILSGGGSRFALRAVHQVQKKLQPATRKRRQWIAN
jgi:hypothetical protein